jgi:hypothetical protein
VFGWHSCYSNSPNGWILEESFFRSGRGKKLFSFLNTKHWFLVPSGHLCTIVVGVKMVLSWSLPMNAVLSTAVFWAN